MAVTNSDWESILQYMQKTLLEEINSQTIPTYKDTIQNIQDLCKYESWKEWKSKQKKPKKQLSGKYLEEFQRLWNLWPTMRSFEYKGRKFTCQKPFKTNQEGCLEKYTKIMETGEISANQLYIAAETALTWCMENSYRKGRNEMEFMNGLIVWLNQKQYRNWLEVSMPSKEIEPKVVNTMDI